MTTPVAAQDLLPSADELRRLRWRCRRGLLENDLFVDRFFETHGDQLTVPLVQGLLQLMDLADNDLLDLLLARKEPEGELSNPDVLQVLSLMRVPMAHEAAAAIRAK
ncbi:succinate dehydrogenase assembly factor 2 [Aquabacterium sp.]|uniref:succinate dehydrogenase assembly factor 2 n=1 Tax=Aquabacterium sp. TaxID=1872578 RepID=UPI002E32F5E9|nr:succinate dehydrogenase assembly factor 2 [Aquabacterium sp.]HEX5312816.1 succinate dehydrogenase assembly factor 2 [Aquabacterium sp.]